VVPRFRTRLQKRLAKLDSRVIDKDVYTGRYQRGVRGEIGDIGRFAIFSQAMT